MSLIKNKKNRTYEVVFFGLLIGAVSGLLIDYNLDTVALGLLIISGICVFVLTIYSGYAVDPLPYSLGVAVSLWVGLALSDTLLARDIIREAPVNFSLLLPVGLITWIVAAATGLGYRSLTEGDIDSDTKRRYITGVIVAFVAVAVLLFYWSMASPVNYAD